MNLKMLNGLIVWNGGSRRQANVGYLIDTNISYHL
jgi:hypothetical protein